MHEIFGKLISEWYSERKNIRDSADYTELVLETKSGDVINFSV